MGLLQWEKVCLTLSRGWGGKTLVILLTMGILGTSHSAFFHLTKLWLLFTSFHIIWFFWSAFFSSAFPGCFVLLTFILGLLSYAIKSIIFKMICKTDLSLDDLCFVGGLGITAFIFRDFGVCFSHKLEPHHQLNYNLWIVLLLWRTLSLTSTHFSSHCDCSQGSNAAIAPL